MKLILLFCATVVFVVCHSQRISERSKMDSISTANRWIINFVYFVIQNVMSTIVIQGNVVFVFHHL